MTKEETMLRSTFILCAIIAGVVSKPNPNGCTELCGRTYLGGINNNLDVDQTFGGTTKVSQSSSSSYRRDEQTIDRHSGNAALVAPLQGVSNSQTGSGGNWHRADSWLTDGGHGRVHEEEGQLVDGTGTRINYYRKNYTASYGNTGEGGHNVAGVILPEIQPGFDRLQGASNAYGSQTSQSLSGVTGTSEAMLEQMRRFSEASSYRDVNSNQQPQRPAIVYGQYGAVNVPVVRTETLEHVPVRIEKTSETRHHYEEKHATRPVVTSVPVITRVPVITSVPVVARAPIYTSTIDQSAVQRTAGIDSMRLVDDRQTQPPQNIFHDGSQSYDLVREREHVHRYGSNSGGAATTMSMRDQRQRVGYGQGSGSDVQLIVESPVVLQDQRLSGHRSHAHSSHGQQQRSWTQTHQSQVITGESHSNSQDGRMSVGVFDLGQNVPNSEICHYHRRKRDTSLDHESRLPPHIRRSRFHRRHEHHFHRRGHYDAFDTTQQTSGFGEIEFGQDSQHGDMTQQTDDGFQAPEFTRTNGHHGHPASNGRLEFGRGDQESQDMTQQTNGFGEHDFGQNTEDLTQQTSDFGEIEHGRISEDLTQQTSDFGKIEHGQISEDLTQQTSDFGKIEHGQISEDLTQQTSDFGKIEHGQISEDLTQQTNDFGKIEHGQISEDLTQQTGDFGKIEHGQISEDLTQQTNDFGKIEHGQISEDLTQQTNDFGKIEHGQSSEDLTQQTSDFGKIEHGRGSEDLTQQTSGFGKIGLEKNSEQDEDLTQQTGSFGKLEFGHNHHPRQDMTQQTNDFGKIEFGQQNEDLTQQTSGFGKLEFGQNSQHDQDLTQHTGDLGKLEFERNEQQSQDMTQQTNGFGKIEFGPESGDLTQQTSGFGKIGQDDEQDQDMTQLTDGFGKLQFGLNHQHNKDLIHETGPSGHLEFGQNQQNVEQDQDLVQQTHNFGKLESVQNHRDNQDMTQQSGGFGKLEFGHDKEQNQDMTQQTSGFGKLEFGHDEEHNQGMTQQTSGFGKLELVHNHQEDQDMTQQTSGFGKLELVHNHQEDQDMTQQTSGFGKHEFGQSNEQNQDMIQQTSGFETLGFGQNNEQNQDMIQQTSGFGKLELVHNHQEDQGMTQQTTGSGKHEFGQSNEQDQDMIQQTSGFGKLELVHNHREDQGMTQQTSGFGNVDFSHNHQQSQDFAQQDGTVGKIEFGQNSEKMGPGRQQLEATPHPYVLNKPLQFGVPPQYAMNQRDLNESSGNKASQGIQQGIDSSQQTASSGNLEFEPYSRRDQHSRQEADRPNNGWRDTTAVRDDREDTIRENIGTNAKETRQQPRFQKGVKGSRRVPPRKPTVAPEAGDTNVPDLNTLPWDVQPEPELANYARYGPNVGTSQKLLDSRATDAVAVEEPFKFQPRILEVYGGKGPYDSTHGDDVFANAKQNPSAELSPTLNGKEPWEIREKPVTPVESSDLGVPVDVPTTTASPEVTSTTQAPSFWRRLGHKLENAYGKVKEKATGILGK